MSQQIDIVANLLMKVDGAEAGINKLKNSLSKLKMPSGLEDSFKKSFSNLDSILERYRNQVSKGFENKQDFSAFNKVSKELDAELERISNTFTKLTGKQIDFKVNSQEVKQAEIDLDNAIKAKEKLAQSSVQIKVDTAQGKADLESLLKKFQEIAGDTKAGRGAGNALVSLEQGNITATIAGINQLIAGYKNLGETKKEAFAKIDPNIKGVFDAILLAIKPLENEFKTVNGEVERTQQALLNVKGDQVNKAGEAAARGAAEFGAERKAIEEANSAMRDHASAINNTATQVKQLQQSTQYFFSLRNMINLLKRGLREAMSTIKELDAAMTKTAVVTNFSVGDMWEKLPEYTANANALGASVKDMYEATTLYYQQGLNAQQAMGIATETMKMARIGGLEAADATDKMTAALRGFNMELNETSAQRVNDVYSNLAAKTASDTNELGTAMQRTASIAASAGMSFEGTAAFLAQAIETTREPAENLGTAMKTIVARFTELKKNPLEITEVDGEEVSYNKVDTALQSIGVSLKDANGQFRDLDKVFLDISQRWNSLTQTQQRYIATTAAGSRQQSRFIAMMSNYERTTELMDYANNANGASAEQFGKTLESLEAKINKFKNAWKQFLMGIMNDKATKFVVDGTTKILNVVNKLIDVLSFNGKLGLVKSLLSLGTAFTALRGVGRLVNGGIGKLGKFIDPTTRRGALGSSGAGITGKITMPIVSKLNEVIAAIKQQKQPNQTKTGSTLSDYNTAVQQLRGMTNGSVRGVRSALSNLSDKHAQAALTNAPGTMLALQRTSSNWLANATKGLSDSSQKVGQQLMRGIYKGMQTGEITPKQGMQLLGNPAMWGKYFGTDVAKSFSKEFSAASRGRSQARQMSALQQAWRNTKGDDETYGYQNIRDYLNDPKVSKERKREILQEYKRIRRAQRSGGLNEENLQPTKYEQLANKVGAVGNAFTSAGFSMQQFGAQLAMLHPSLQGLGNLISRVGIGVSTLGMSISGFGKIVPKVASGITSLIGLLGPGGFAGAAVLAVGAAVALGVAIAKDLNIKKKAQEIVDTFEEVNKSTTENIGKLEEWQTELEYLSAGVDANGINISLETGDYDRYREIINGIAEINPDIVKGYNAQGDAIIDNNNALQETLRLQKQIRKEASVKYTKNSSLQTLIDARNLNEDYQVNQRGDFVNTFDMDVTAFRAALSKEIDMDELSARLGFDIANATSETMSLNAELIAKAATDLSGSTEVGQAVDEFLAANQKRLEVTQDIYKSLSTYASQERYDLFLSDDVKDIYQNELKQIAATPNLTAREMKKEAYRASRVLKVKDSRIKEITDAIEEAQSDYALDLNTDAYNKKIDEIQKKNQQMIDGWKESGNLALTSLAANTESLFTQAKAWTESSTEGLVDAFNTVQSSIKAASSAYDEFKKSVEGTSTGDAAESLKQITEDMYDGTNAQFGGNSYYWKGAQNFVDSDLIGDFEDTEKIMKRIKPTLEDSTEGINASITLMHDLATELQGTEWANFIEPTANGFKLIQEMNAEQWAEIAKYKGWSTQYMDYLLAVTSRVGSFVTADMEEIRRNYSRDERVFDTGVEEGKEGNILWIKESEFISDLIDADQVGERSDIEKGLEAKNVDIIPDKLMLDDKTINKEFQKIADGVINKDNWAEALDTLRYDKDEIIDYAVAAGLANNKEEAEKTYEDYVTQSEDPLLAEANGYLAREVELLESINAGVGVWSTSDYRGQELQDLFYGGEGNDTPGEFWKLGKNSKGEDFKTKEEADKEIETATAAWEEAKDYLKGAKDNLDKLNESNATPEQIKQAQEDYDKAAAVVAELGLGVQALKGAWGNREYSKGAEKTANERLDVLQQNDTYGKLFKDIDTRSAQAQSALETLYSAFTFEGTSDIDWSEQSSIYREQIKVALSDLGLTIEEAVEKGLIKNYTPEGEEDSSYTKPGQPSPGGDFINVKALMYGLGKFLNLNNPEVGNTDLYNRPIIDWGNDPTKNKNYKAAQSWGYTKKDLKGTKSTYMSSAMTFGEGDNAFTLTYTPVLPDGTVLDKNTTEEYVKKLVDQSTDENGNVDYDTLFNLDKMGVDGISGLFMGAFTGPNGGMDFANNFAKVTQIMSDLITQGYGDAIQNLDPSQIAQDTDAFTALKNVYNDILKGTIPKSEDLQTLNLDSLDTTTKNTTTLGEKLKNLWHAYGEIDKAAMAEPIGGADNVEKAITEVGERLKSWWDKIKNIFNFGAGSKNPENPAESPEQNGSVSTPTEPPKYDIDTSAGIDKINELQAKVDDTKTSIEAGANFTIHTSGAKKLTTAAKAAQNLTNSSGEKTIKVKTGKVDTGSVKDAKQSIGNTEAKIRVGANVDSATASVRKLVRDTNAKTATIDVKADYSKSKWTHDVDIYVHKHDAKGEHNHGYAKTPTFNSAAKGYGQIGPKGKGGLTLTGELGYEIAWLPDENRSMILGANGPQLIDLPGNAVVWTHEQSKKILKQKAIPAGSHAKKTGTGEVNLVNDSGGNGDNQNNSSKKGTKGKNTKPKKPKSNNTTKIIKKAGKVLVWWENIARRADKAQRNADKAQKKLENLLKKFGTTLNDYEQAGQSYIQALNNQQKIAKQQEARANKELKLTDKGRNALLSKEQKQKAKTAATNLKEAKAAYNKAKKTSGKADDKKTKKAYEKAQKAYKKATSGRKSKSYMEAIGARQEISYEVTKKKKGKKTTETKKQKVNLSKYIKQENGVYIIDQKQIDAVAKTNKSKAEAIKQAAEKQLNDLLSKQKSAEDERIKAEEALKQFYDDTYEAFNQWDKVITEAYLLGKEIEKLGNLRNIYDAVEDLELSKLEAGFSSISDSLLLVNQALAKSHENMVQQVQANFALVNSTWKDYQDWLTGKTARLEYEQHKDSDKAKAQWESYNAAKNFLATIGQKENFDYSKAVDALYAIRYSVENYDQIKEGLDKIYERQSDYYNAVASTYTSMAEVYKTIEEYQAYMADFEDSLIKGLEEQADREINRLDKINNSLTEAAKKIIDEVKRKLDERRQKEDNAQKEQEISQKQQRLAMLRADTAGGHQVEIAQLEKEIADTQQDYQRTLEDQLLDRLQDQADKAAEQRERQISLLEAQRDLAVALGTNVEEVNRLLSNPKANWERIQELWLANAGNDEAGNYTREQNLEKFSRDFVQFLAYSGALPDLKQLAEENKLPADQIKIPTTVDQINTKMDTIIDLLGGEKTGTAKFTAQELHSVGMSAKAAKELLTKQNGKAPSMKEMMDAGYKDLAELKGAGYSANAFASNNISYANAKKAGFSLTQLSKASQYAPQAYKDAIEQAGKNGKTSYDEITKLVEIGNAAGYDKKQILTDLAKTKVTWEQILTALRGKWNKYRLALTFDSDGFKKAYNKVYGSGTANETNASLGGNALSAYDLARAEAKKKKLTKYDSGGLASETGPAWLDGTPSKPELILSATDTKNFIALKDVLSRAVDSIGSSDNYGNVMYEININVDKIEKDYDVDRVVDKVKKEIVKSSGYRNVTQVRNLR